jgi:hypothetical protein
MTRRAEVLPYPFDFLLKPSPGGGLVKADVEAGDDADAIDADSYVQENRQRFLERLDRKVGAVFLIRRKDFILDKGFVDHPVPRGDVRIMFPSDGLQPDYLWFSELLSDHLSRKQSCRL